MTPESRSVTHSTTLRRGDVVVLYTDGVTDAPPPYEILPGEIEALIVVAAREACTADAVAANIGAAIDNVLSLADRHDDIALLVLRID